MGVRFNKNNFPDPYGVLFMNDRLRDLVLEARRKGYYTTVDIIGYVKSQSGYLVTYPKVFCEVYL